MATEQLLLTLVIAIASVSAQWKGDIGASHGNGDWKVSGGASYDFANGKGSVGTKGYYDSKGNYGVEAKLSYSWGRRRRSVQNDGIIKQMCKECVSVETITSPEKLDQYTKIHKVDFGMIARFKRFYQNENETILSFKIKEILTQPPTDFNITAAKVFNIYAEKGPCALICLKDFVHDNYIVTGAMFHGRLIIYDKLVLFHPGQPKVSSEEYEVPDEENEGEDY